MARRYDFRTTAALPSGVTVAAYAGALTGAAAPTMALTAAGAVLTGTSSSPPVLQMDDTRAIGPAGSDAEGGIGEEGRLENQFIYVVMKASAGRFAGVHFNLAGTGKDTDQNIIIPIRPDDTFRTYNRWVGQNFMVPRYATGPNSPYGSATGGETMTPLNLPGRTSKGTLQPSRFRPKSTQTITAAITADSKIAVLTAPNNGLFPGALVTGAGIGAGTRVQSNSGTTLELNYKATATNAAATLTVETRWVGNPVKIWGSEVPGATATIAYWGFSASPLGPVNLVIDHAGIYGPMCRVGVAAWHGVRVRNMGGVIATGIAVSATGLPSGVTFTAPTSYPTAIPPDEERTIYFRITSSTAGLKKFNIVVSCTQGDSASFPVELEVDPALPSGFLAALTTGKAPRPVVPPASAQLANVFIWHYFAHAASDLIHGLSTANAFEMHNEGMVDQTTKKYWDWMFYWVNSHCRGIHQLEMYANTELGWEAATAMLASDNLPDVEFCFSFINHDNTQVSGTTIRDYSPDTTYATKIYQQQGLPSNSVGRQFDFYIDTDTRRFYGPKNAANVWPANYVEIPAGVPLTTTVNSVVKDSWSMIWMANWFNYFNRAMPWFRHPSYHRAGGPDGPLHISLYGARYFLNGVAGVSVPSTATPEDKHVYLMANVLARTEKLLLEDGIAGGCVFSAGHSNLEKAPLGGTTITYQSMKILFSEGYNAFGAGANSNGLCVVTGPQMTALYRANRWPGQARTTGDLASSSLLTTTSPKFYMLTNFDHRSWMKERWPEWLVTVSYEDWVTHLSDVVVYLREVSAAPTYWRRAILIAAQGEIGEKEMLLCGRHQFRWLRALLAAIYPGVPQPTMVMPSDVSDAIPQLTGLTPWVAFPSPPPGNQVLTATEQGITIPPNSYIDDNSDIVVDGGAAARKRIWVCS